MSQEELDPLVELDDMGAIDYVLLAWPAGRPEGSEVAPLIVDLVDRGIIAVLDIAFVAKDDNGEVTSIDLEHLGADSPFAVFEGAASGLLDFEDVKEAAASLEPGSSACVIVWENRWSVPVAKAVRRSGGLLLDGGRIPVQGILAALDALEAAQAN